jgi:hypothetical protein
MKNLARASSVLPVLLATLAALGAGAPAASASGTLYSVLFDTSAAEETLVVVDPATGALAAPGAGIADCCFIASGVSSLDPDGGVFFFMGRRMSDGADDFRIWSLDLGTGAAAANPLVPAGNNYNFLEFDPSSGTLYAVVFDTGAAEERLVEIDPATGALTPVGAGIADCCLIPSGVSALDPAGGVFFFVGRRMSDGADDFRIWSLDLATGGVVANPLLPAGNNWNFLEFDPSSGTLYAVVFDTGTAEERLVEVDPATGALSPVGAGIADCCFISSGVSALDPGDGEFHFMGRRMSDGADDFRIWSLDLATGAVAANPLLPAGNNYNFLEFDPEAEPPGPIEVAIDVKPGSFPNSINPRSNGVIPVAILTTPGFDALSVDAATLRFSGPAGAPIAHAAPHPEDADGDGDVDLVVHFRTRQTGIACGDVEATLVGATVGGDPITGSDGILTVGCK